MRPLYGLFYVTVCLVTAAARVPSENGDLPFFAVACLGSQPIAMLLLGNIVMLLLSPADPAMAPGPRLKGGHFWRGGSFHHTDAQRSAAYAITRTELPRLMMPLSRSPSAPFRGSAPRRFGLLCGSDRRLLPRWSTPRSLGLALRISRLMFSFR